MKIELMDDGLDELRIWGRKLKIKTSEDEKNKLVFHLRSGLQLIVTLKVNYNLTVKSSNVEVIPNTFSYETSEQIMHELTSILMEEI